MDIKVSSTDETKKFAELVSSSVACGDVIALYGDLGAGKTTFTKYLAEALGFTSRVQSPTFVIVRHYEKPKNVAGPISNMYHIDLYRFEGTKDLQDIDLAEFFLDPNGLTVIEWPELAEDILPKNTKKIKIEYIDEDTRKIHVQNLY